MGSSANDNFVLRWSDFQSNVASSFLALRVEEDFFDVTLACDEDHQLQAHKVVLAASSAFLRGMLKRNPAQHPVLVMPPNVGFSELASLLDFIYHGEVTVPHEQLDALIMLAQMLKVKGLVDEVDGMSSKKHQQQQQQQQQKMAKPPHGVNAKQRRQSSGSQDRGEPDQQAKSKNKNSQPQKLPPLQVEKDYQEGNAAADADKSESDCFEAASSVSSAAAEPERLVQPQQPPPPPTMEDHPEMVQPPPAPPPPQPQTSEMSTRFIALQCPQCPQELPGPDAFKRHMEEMHPVMQQQQQQHGYPEMPPAKKKKLGRPIMSKKKEGEELEDTTTFCPICDKAFKNKAYARAHQKRMHKYEDGGEVPKAAKRGRPPKKKMEDENLGDGSRPEEQVMFEEDPTVKKARKTPQKQRDGDLRHPAKQAKPERPQHEPQGPPPRGRIMSPKHSSMRPQQEHPEDDHHFDHHGEPRPGPSGMLRQQRPFSHRGSGGGRDMRRGGGRGRGGAAAAPAMAAGQPQDLKKSLGLKFGGQISITSSDHGGRGGGAARGGGGMAAAAHQGDSQGYSIYRSPSGRGRRPQGRPPPPQNPTPQPPVEIKQEMPEEEEFDFAPEEDEYGEEDFEGMEEFEMGEVMYGGEGEEEGYMDEEEGEVGEFEENLGEEEEDVA